MRASPNDSDGQPAPPDKSTVILLLRDMGDTTWRMFVPTIGLALVGYWLDKQWHTAPWIMLLGLIIGSVLAGLLVRRQLKKVNE